MRPGPILAFLIIAGAGYGLWRWIEMPPDQTVQIQAGPGRGGRGNPFGGRRGGGGGNPANAVPVSVEAVRVETIPITREGIGNVQARRTVTVRAQVDGPLVSVDFTEGQIVRAGDVLARIDPAIYRAQLDQALAKKAQDEANLANAQVDLQRYRSLAASAAGPKQQADQQAATVAQLSAQVKADDAAIASARTMLGYTTIVAPLDGRTGLRQIDPGNIVRASDSSGLVTITQITPIDAVFTLPQRDLPLVTAAQAKGKVAVDVLAPGGDAPLASGELAAIDNQIDASTGTIRLKATFPNADRALWPGQFVSVRITVDRLVDARVVPAAAVRRGSEGNFVYVIDSEDRAVTRPVVIAVQDETRAAIARGLEPGEKVVTVGFARLSPGAAVVIAADPAAPPAGENRSRRGRGPAPAIAPADGAPNAAAPASAETAAPEREPNAPRGERGPGRRGDGQGRRPRNPDGTPAAPGGAAPALAPAPAPPPALAPAPPAQPAAVPAQ